MSATSDESGKTVDVGVDGVIPLSVCWQLLRSTPFGRFAIYSPNDGVDIFPVNHVVDAGSIVFRTAGGTKVSAVDEHGISAFEIDGVDDGDVAWSVVARGRAHVVRRHDEIVEIFDLDIEPWQEGAKPTFIRLQPESVSGRRFVRRPASA